MAEQFIEEIYSRASLSYTYQKCIQYLNQRNMSDFCIMWSNNTGTLMEIISEWAQTDQAKANLLQNYAIIISQNMMDPMLMSQILETGILPLIHEYHKLTANIDVTEGKYQLKSSDSGFLTVYDCDKKCHLHSLTDPMWEAYEKSCALYNGKMNKIVLLGCGLGYLAYQLWKCSFESAEIVIMETDETMIDYAHNYGVLDWINKDQLRIICNTDRGYILNQYVQEYTGENSLAIISDWMVDEFEGDLRASVQMNIDRQRAYIGFSPMYAVNYWRNRAKSEKTILDMPFPSGYERAAVIGAGPSLMENIEYLKVNRDKMCIISVNTALRKLLNAGIAPDYVCIIDPTPDVQCHVEGIEEETKNIPLVTESVAYWGFVDLYQGPVYRALSVDFAPVREEAIAKSVPVLEIGSNVTNLAIELAIYFGFEDIDLIGLDLAFPGNKHHAGDTNEVSAGNLVGSIEVEDVYGNSVMSVETFNHFRYDVEKQITNHRDRRFINISREGARIHGTLSGRTLDYELENPSINILLKQLSDEYRKVYYQLEAWISATPQDREKSIPEQLLYEFDIKELTEKDRELLTEAVNYLMDIAKKENDSDAIIYINSVLYALSDNDDYLIQSIDTAMNDEVFGYSKCFFLYRQISIIKKSCNSSEKLDVALAKLWNKIIDLCDKALKESRFERIPYKPGNSSSIFIFTDEMRDESDYRTKKLLDQCVNMMRKKQVVLINTAEAESVFGVSPFYGAHIYANTDKYAESDSVIYKGLQIPYVHCGNNMPNIDTIKLLLSTISQNAPGELAVYGDRNLVVELAMREEI